jgi:hypothetical protein
LKPINNSLPTIEQILKLSLSFQNQMNRVDFKSLNQILILTTETPALLDDLKNTIIQYIDNRSNSLLTQENFLNNHNILMSFLQENLLTKEILQNTLTLSFVNYWEELKLSMDILPAIMNTLKDNDSTLRNILLDLKNSSVSVAYLEDNIIPLFIYLITP